MRDIPPGLLSRAGLLKLIVMFRQSAHWVPLSLSLETWDDSDLCSEPEFICHSPCHIRPLIGPQPLPSLVTLASHWSRARWQQSWQICPAPIGWPPLNHGQFWKLLRVKMPASVDNIFWALLLTDVYFIFFMSYGWVVPWRRWLRAGCLNTLTAERRRGGETKTVSINCVNYKASDTKHLWKMQTVSDVIMARPRRYLNRSHLASQLEQAARVC